MTEFKSWRSYWEFEHATKQHTRYVRDPESEAFLQAVQHAGERHAEIIPADRFLWRAQLGCNWESVHENEEHLYDIPAAYSQERMKPLMGHAIFKTSGFHGVAYRSSLGRGHNIALFDLDGAELINRFLFQVKEIKFDFEETANRYFLRKHYDNKNSESA